jgi:hypothetical protein
MAPRRGRESWHDAHQGGKIRSAVRRNGDVVARRCDARTREEGEMEVVLSTVGNG